MQGPISQSVVSLIADPGVVVRLTDRLHMAIAVDWDV